MESLKLKEKLQERCSRSGEDGLHRWILINLLGWRYDSIGFGYFIVVEERACMRT